MSNCQVLPICCGALLLVLFATTAFSAPSSSWFRFTMDGQYPSPASMEPVEFPAHIKLLVQRNWMVSKDGVTPVADSNDAVESEQCVTNDAECPYNTGINPKFLMNAKINQLSTSPWKMINNVDENRFPAVIPEACCLCSDCVNYAEDKPTQQLLYHSVEVKETVTVAVRSGTEFKLVNLNITTGCSCTLNSGLSNGLHA